MAITTLQITQSGSAIRLSTTSVKYKWIAFFNTAGATMRVGDANVSSTQGAQLAATTGQWNPPVPSLQSSYGDLSQWWTVGTSTQKLDVVYDSVATP